MYDWELFKYLSDKGNLLSDSEYSFVLDTCPRLNHVKYNPFINEFKAWSQDGNCFTFKVKYVPHNKKEDF